MRTRKSSLILLVSSGLLCLASWMPFQDQDKASVEKRVRMLLAQTGAMNMGKEVMKRMTDALRSQPGLPPGFIAKFEQLANPEELTELVVPIYVKHLDEKTLDAVIAFNNTPAGQKMIAAMPAITRESIAVGQNWGRTLMTKVRAEIRR